MLFFIYLEIRSISIARIVTAPNKPPMQQMARNATIRRHSDVHARKNLVHNCVTECATAFSSNLERCHLKTLNFRTHGQAHTQVPAQRARQGCYRISLYQNSFILMNSHRTERRIAIQNEVISPPSYCPGRSRKRVVRKPHDAASGWASSSIITIKGPRESNASSAGLRQCPDPPSAR